MEEEAKTAQQEIAQPQTQPQAKQQSPLSELKAKKDALLEEAKSLNSQIFDLRSQIAPIVAQLKQSEFLPTNKIRAQIDAIEFEIATSAFTPKLEKELLKGKKSLEAQLKTAAASDALQKKADGLRAQLKLLSDKRKEIDSQLESLRASMAAEYEKGKQEYEKGKKEREKKAYESLKARYGAKNGEPKGRPAAFAKPHQRSRAHGALDPEEAKYLQKHDEFVSLEDIVVLEKKEKQPEAQ